MGFTKITDADLVDKGVIGLPDQPGLSTAAMQNKLEETVRSVAIPKHNALIDELEANTASASLGATALTGRSSSPNVQAVLEKLSTDLKVVEDGMAEAIADAHTHDNKALLDTYEQTETNLADAVSKKHDHSNKALLDTYTQTEANLADAVSKKHDHSNKTVLDKFGESDGQPTYDGNPIGGGGGAYVAGDGIDITGTTISLDYGMLTASNLTKPVTGKDIKDGLDTKQNTLTFDNVPTDGSDNPVKSSGIYSALAPKVSESLLKDTVGWVGKNLLDNKAVSRTHNGVEYTVNTDKSITRYGTASGTSFLVLTGEGTKTNSLDVDYQTAILKTGEKVISSVAMDFKNTDGTYGSIPANTEYTVSKDIGLFYISSSNGTQVDDTIYPMLRDASITDDTYEPYHKSVEDTISDVYGVMGENGAKNIGTNNAITQTIDGVTFTVNSDKSITITGKNTGESYITYDIARPITIPKGHYKMSGSSEFSDNFYLQLRKSDGNISYFDMGSGAEFTLATDLTFNYWAIIVPQGDRQYNVTVKPMIYDARDTDSTYQPHAMTNAELTEKLSSGDLTSQLEWKAAGATYFTPQSSYTVLHKKDGKYYFRFQAEQILSTSDSFVDVLQLPITLPTYMLEKKVYWTSNDSCQISLGADGLLKIKGNYTGVLIFTLVL